MQEVDLDPLLKTVFLPCDEVLDATLLVAPGDPLEKFFREIEFGPIEEGAVMAKSVSTEWDESITPPGDGSLSKAYDSVRQTTRKINIRKFVEDSLAAGETISALVDHAAAHDPETAEMISLIGREIAA